MVAQLMDLITWWIVQKNKNISTFDGTEHSVLLV